MEIGDRVKYKTHGGWYNSGIIISRYENYSMSCPSCLIEVDTLGYKPSENDPIVLPYYRRIPQDMLIVEYESRPNTIEQCLAPSPDLSFYKRKREDKNMTNYEWLVKNKAELVKDILTYGLSKEKGKLGRCSETMCSDCDFRCGACAKITKEWLEAEHGPIYRKGDIVIDPFKQIKIIAEDYYEGDFIKVSYYADHSVVIQSPATSIIKKVGHIESEV